MTDHPTNDNTQDAETEVMMQGEDENGRTVFFYAHVDDVEMFRRAGNVVMGED